MSNERFNEMILNNLKLVDRVNGMVVAPYQDKDHPNSLWHLSWVLNTARDLYAQGHKGKADRWLGFVQGVLSAKYDVSVERLRVANTV